VVGRGDGVSDPIGDLERSADGRTVIVPIPVAVELLPRLLEGVPCERIRLAPPPSEGGRWSLEVTTP
jgi:hypothetical protein